MKIALRLSLGLWLVAAPSLARAHLKSSYASAGSTLREATVLVLVEAVSPTQKTPEGARTAVRTVVAIAGRAPETFDMVQQGHHLHSLRAGERVLAPLARSPAGRWRYTADTREALQVERRTERAALRFVRRWRAAPAAPPAERLDDWIAATQDPSALARRVGLEAITDHFDRVAPLLRGERLERLAAPLIAPGGAAGDEEVIVRLLGRLPEGRGAVWLARHFAHLSPHRLRHPAAAVIGRHRTPESRAALRRCADEAGGTLATRCARLLGRMGPPETP
ncbi:MAG: hypothetical protein H6704_21195 [Myxococcales bacterium]|nr:hypothetical protein [Myxococcales bacterium]